eukprot:GHVL01038627.1.p1 GENE.GHVL01038627.1~~GHVL01038627.1.p1  ORF type:complete len:208 (-),score=53.55 GHVL01038627.1:16-606(-)
MFSLISGFVKWFLAKTELRLIIIGLDNAGKSTTVEQVKRIFSGKSGMELDEICPTMGLNVASVQIDGNLAVFWDLGGQTALRPIWKSYFSETDGIVYIIDTSDTDRIHESYNILNNALNDENLRNGVPLLIFANKQDIKESLDISDISKILDIESILQKRCVHLHSCSAKECWGIQEGIRWVVNEAKKFNKTAKNT